MKKSLRYVCAFAMLLCCLVSCSGHSDTPAPAESVPLPTESPEPAAEPAEPEDPLARLLAAFPWGAEEELKLEEDGSGEYMGLPISWQRSGVMVYIRLLPDSCVGRLIPLRLDRSGPVLRLYGAVGEFVFNPCVDKAALRLQRIEQRRQDYIALQRAQGEAMSQMALGFVGGRYKYGGKSPETGFDCSGMIWYIYDQFGYNLERVAAQQAKQGVHVEPADMLPGDLLAFRTSGSYVGHVGLYVGNGYYVHAMGEAYGVVLTALDDPYLKRDFEARRLIGQPELMKYVPEGYAALMFPDGNE